LSSDELFYDDIDEGLIEVGTGYLSAEVDPDLMARSNFALHLLTKSPQRAD
jgi:hypothetical protein